MLIDFDVETSEGKIGFKGELNKEEVDFLLRFALLSLMARGTLPNIVDISTGEKSETLN